MSFVFAMTAVGTSLAGVSAELAVVVEVVVVDLLAARAHHASEAIAASATSFRGWTLTSLTCEDSGCQHQCSKRRQEVFWRLFSYC